jgi:hypothetical protein
MGANAIRPLALLDFEEVIKMVPHHSIAFAGAVFKARAIQDYDLASAVLDEAIPLQGFRGKTDGRPAVAQHMSQIFLSERKSGGFEAVRAEQ